MIETLISSILVIFVPGLIEKFSMPGGLMVSMALSKLLTILVIVLITLVTNISKARRFCIDKDGKSKSWGISYGIKKGLMCGFIALLFTTIIGIVPILKIPFTLIRIIPFMGEHIDGFILSTFYLLSHILVAYPIWGSC